MSTITMTADLMKKFKPERHAIVEHIIVEMKTLYRMDNRSFVMLVKKYFGDLNIKHKVGSFASVWTGLSVELGNIAPFIAPELNKFFKLLYDIGFFKHIVEYLSLFQTAADQKTLMYMRDILARRDVQKIYTGVEIYQLKKTVIELTGKFRSKKEVVEHFDAHIAPIDSLWLDYPQS